ncbi:MAG: ABC transporter ATP-binding protein [Sedimentisphaerales bacterium]|jgi:lipopolysaccharide transport system ATP-binding protein
MWYGFRDILRDTAGLRPKSDRLRRKEFWAVDDVSFELKKGETLGLIGPNGAGKTTLLKMLNGIIIPDKGSLRIKGRVGALIQIGAGFHPQLTGRENVYINGAILGMGKREIDKRFDTIVDFADIGDFLDTPVKFYSSGMFVRLGMAVAMHTEPTILLVDEVFAVGDIKFQAKCFNRIGELRRQGVAFILVSHNIHHISGYADRVLVLNQGQIWANGDPESTVKKYLELMKTQPQKESMATEEIPNGTGRVRFKDVYLCDNGENRVSSLDSTSPFALRIDYKAVADFNDVELDVVIYDTQSKQIFFQGSNLLYNHHLRIENGIGKILVRFACLPKNNGRLHFTVSLWSKGRYELFDWNREIVVSTSGCAISKGFVWLPCSFETVRDRQLDSNVT